MRKVISLVLVFIMVLMTVSCGKTEPIENTFATTTELTTIEETTTEEIPTEIETTTKKITVTTTTTKISTTEEITETTKKIVETSSVEETSVEPTEKETSTEPEETTVFNDVVTLTEVVRKSAKKYGATGIQVALISNGKVSVTEEYGWAMLNKHTMEKDTKIRIASLSKTLVGMVAFRLVEQGKLDLNADISDYLGVTVRNPAFPNEVITLQMLLTHTSGIKDADYVNSLEDLQKHFLSAGAYTQNKPGTKYHYNNFGFGVIGTICEIVENESFTTLANKYFFYPMGIIATYIPSQLKSSQMASLHWSNNAVGSDSFTENDKIIFTNTPGQSMSLYAGGLIISAVDYAKLLTLFMNDGIYNGKQLLSPDSIRQMHKVRLTQPESKVKQCMPMCKQKLYGENLYYHTGSAYGVHSFYSYNLKKKTGVVIVTIGASNKKDKLGIYSVCSDIASSVYE